MVLVHASQKKFEKIKAFLFQFGLYRSLGLETFLHIFFCRSTLKQLVLGSKGRNRKKRTLNAKATDPVLGRVRLDIITLPASSIEDKKSPLSEDSRPRLDSGKEE